MPGGTGTTVVGDVETKTPEQIAADTKTAADKAAADTAAAEKATADKAAADKAAADAAAAGAKTPEQLAAEKAAADAETARTAADKAKAPEKYELKLAEQTAFDATDVEAVAAEAKALGLTTVQAQALLDGRTAAVAQLSSTYLADLKADKALGGEHYDTTVKHAQAGRDWLFKPGEPTTPEILAFFNKTGLGNHKALVGALARIGKALAEDTPVTGRAAADGKTETRLADQMYPSTAHLSKQGD